MSGKFVWYDLNTKAPAEARAFYAALFGWNIVDWLPEGAPAGADPYPMVAIGDKPFGGIAVIPEHVPSPNHWMGYVAVDDVDAAMRRATTRGAQFPAGAVDIPTVGRSAIMVDPEGCVSALFMPLPGGNMNAPDAMSEGMVAWNELTSADPDAAIAFYGDVVGWGSDKSAMEGMEYWLFGPEDGRTAGLMRKTDEMPASMWLLYFTVADCDATQARVGELGGRVYQPAFDVPGVGRMAVVAGPGGEAFGISEWRMEDM